MSLQTTLEAQLTAIQTAITTALASPAPNWRVGEVEFNQQDYLKFLYDQQSKLIEELRKIPSEDISTAQNDVNAIGQDGTEYLGEEF